MRFSGRQRLPWYVRVIWVEQTDYGQVTYIEWRSPPGLVQRAFREIRRVLARIV
jgi:hypothetical protein